MPELLYESDGEYCGRCRTRWRVYSLHDRRTTCPECGSGDIQASYPEIPDLSDDPLLLLIVAAEGQIPRAENGAILPREMAHWLRTRGVRTQAEHLQWARWFGVIATARSRATEDLMDEQMGARRRQAEDGEE